jgi:hypothetical protein
MLPIKDDKDANPKLRKVFIFFDFECRQDDMVQCESGYLPDEKGKCKNCQASTCGAFEHVPNLCVVQKVCTVCMNQNIDEKSLCHECGKNELVFSGPETTYDFCQWLFSGVNFGATVLCHNFKGYDSYPILQYLFKNNIVPKVIPNGTKTVSLNIKGCKIRMIDSLSFLPMALSKLPATFGFEELSKGYFPHLFNRKENQNVILDHLPDIRFYNPDSMKVEDRSRFVEWYAKHRNDTFDFQKELLKYCRSDVDILRKCVMRFRNDFLEITGVDPISTCTTIASACHQVFKRNFLEPNTIGIIPPRGYHPEQIQSAKALQWMKYVEKKTGCKIQNVNNGGEKVIGPYRVDGYYETQEGEKVVLEFHGDFWHGNPEKFSKDMMNPVAKITMGDLYNRTMQKKLYMEKLGYTFKSIWESEFETLMKEDVLMKRFIESLDVAMPLQPREAFYGKRVETFHLFKSSEEEEISCYRLNSLYSFVNKWGKHPVGHPRIITEGFQELEHYEGLIRCKMIPPKTLFIPVLPSRIREMLMFVLCRSCAELQQQTQCTHTDDQRAITGTWVTDEVKKAVEKGYVVDKIYEVWHFDKVSQYNTETRKGGIFFEYVNTFMKINQEALGWPSWCKTEEDRENYIKQFEEKEGFVLDVENIRRNTGLQVLADLMLNVTWRKFAQRENFTQVEYVKDLKIFYQKLTSKSSTVTELNFVSDRMVAMSWNNNVELSDSSVGTNVVLAAYTAAQARLKMYSYLERLGRRILYIDHDFIVFSSKQGDWKPELSDLSGGFSNVAEDNIVQAFISAGPQTFAYSLQKPNEEGNRTCCTIKGKAFDRTEPLKIDASSVDRIVKNVKDQPNVHFENENNKVKDYKIQFDKRVRTELFATVPYGWTLNQFIES